jgi:ABC-2 type transport system permease protein
MNLRHIALITKREYNQRLRSPGFIIGTILGVVGFLALAFLPSLIKLLDETSNQKIAIVDPKNLIFPYLPINTGPVPTPDPGSGLSQPGVPISAGVQFVKTDTTDLNVLSAQVRSGALGAYIIVEGDSPSDVNFRYQGKDRPSQTVSARLLALLTAAVIQARFQESGITPQQAQALFSTPTLKVEPIVSGTLKDEKTFIQSSALVYVLLVLLYITMLMYGIQVAMGVVEEKSSRVMEILITAIRPIELMLGKVFGIGLLGLTQYAIWVTAGLVVLLLSGSLGSTLETAGISLASVPAPTLIFFLVFFVLGYLLIACIYAALGSLVNRTEEVNSITTPISLVMVATYLLSIWALGNPESDVVKGLSFVPFFTPMLMFIRISLSNPGWWEVALSILILAASSLFFAWVAAKIYRAGVLLYGKRPSFREIARLLRAT